MDEEELEALLNPVFCGYSGRHDEHHWFDKNGIEERCEGAYGKTQYDDDEDDWRDLY